MAGKTFEVTGLAWMDHEFFTHQLEADQVGWDWLSLQLDDKTELMLFRIRRKDGSVDPFSAGTFVDANGGQTHLRAGDFTLTPQSDVWKSPRTHASYPIRWKISVPKLEIEVEAGDAAGVAGNHFGFQGWTKLLGRRDSCFGAQRERLSFGNGIFGNDGVRSAVCDRGVMLGAEERSDSGVEVEILHRARQCRAPTTPWRCFYHLVINEERKSRGTCERPG